MTDPTPIALVANILGTHTRTLRRRLQRSPALRSLLKASRPGSRRAWRFDYPRHGSAFFEWLDLVKAEFHSLPAKRSAEPEGEFVRRFKRELGVGDPVRARDVETLRSGLDFVAANLDRSRVDDSELNGQAPGFDPFERCRQTADEICISARVISSKFGCPVREAIRHWPRYLREKKQEALEANSKAWDRLNHYGLKTQAEHLIEKGYRHFNIYEGFSNKSGQRRIGLVPFLIRPRKDSTWRRARLQLERVELKTEPSEQEIERELEDVEMFWPNEKQWQSSQNKRIGCWQRKCLVEAIQELELDSGGKVRPTAKNLAPLLFRNQAEGDKWKRFQEQRRLRADSLDPYWDHSSMSPTVWTLSPPAQPDSAKRRRNTQIGRGISVAEFRTRYTREMLRKAKAIARRVDGSSLNLGSSSSAHGPAISAEDLEGMSIRDERGREVVHREAGIRIPPRGR